MATRGTTRGVLSVLLICFLVSSGCLAGKNQKLSYENWHQMLEGEWMIKFFAPWCPACQRVASVWSSLASKAESLGIKVAEVDTTKEPALSGRFMVFSLPTIFHVKNGEFRKYEGQRSLQGFTDFITEEKWREVEPIPWWKSPSSFMMWSLGVTFKLSLFLKDLHELITVTYGLPDWASYTIFGLTTVLTGLFLGMVLVVVSDRIFASPSIPTPPPKKEDELQSGEECDNKDEQKETVKTAQDINTEESNSVRKRVLKVMNKATVNIGKDRENLSIVIDYVVVPLLIDLVNRENEELKRWLAEAIAI